MLYRGSTIGIFDVAPFLLGFEALLPCCAKYLRSSRKAELDQLPHQLATTMMTSTLLQPKQYLALGSAPTKAFTGQKLCVQIPARRSSSQTFQKTEALFTRNVSRLLRPTCTCRLMRNIHRNEISNVKFAVFMTAL